MRLPAVLLPLLLVSSIPAIAQTGFSSKTYNNIQGSQLLSADLNGDSAPDLVTGSGILFNDGSGNFGTQTSLPGGPFSYVAIADMNGDSYPDIIGCTTTSADNSSQQMSITVDINNGNRTFTAKPAVTAPGTCFQLAVGDVYRTSHPAVVAVGFLDTYPAPATPQNKFYVFRNDGNGNLTLAQTSTPNLDSPSGTPSSFTNCSLVSVVGGDFKKDGNFDLVLSTYCNPPQVQPYNFFGSTLFYVTQGAASSPGYQNFTFMQTSNPQLSNGKPVDINGDGSLDILYLSTGLGYGGFSPYSVAFALNNGSGAFTFPTNTNIDSEGTGTSAAIADFNGDGIQDAAVTASQSTSGASVPPTLTIYSGTSNGSYTQSAQANTGPSTANPGDVVAADFNHDGKPDIATLVYDTSSRLTTLLVDLNTQNGGATACNKPSTANSVIICSPANGANVSSGSVSVTAASNVTNFVHNRLYLDNVDVFDTSDSSQLVSTSVTASSGSHHLVLVSYNASGQAFTASANFTVGTGTNGCIPTAASAMICSPASGSTITTQQVTVTAGARAQTGFLTAMRVYVDNVAVYTVNTTGNPTTYQFTQSINVNPGTHTLVVVAYESTGAALTSSRSFTSNAGPCTPDASTNSVRICSPAASTPVSSPVLVSAGAHTVQAQSYLVSMRIYIDNVAVYTANNNVQSESQTLQQSIPVAPGTHNMVIVGYPDTGGYVSASETIVVH